MAHSVSMAAVGKAAGVSAITVSRVFRRHPSVRPETDARVRAAAELLGYRPDPLVGVLMARLRSGRIGATKSTLGLVNLLSEPLASHPSPRLRALHRGLVARAAALGFALTEFRVGAAAGALSPSRLDTVLRARGVAGLVVGIATEASCTLALDWSRFDSVAVGFSLREPRLHRVAPDHYHNMLALCRHLREDGRRRIGLCVDRNSAERTDYLWVAGLRSHQEHARAVEKTEPLILDDFYAPKNRAAIAAWIRSEKLDAIISNHEQVPGFPAEKRAPRAGHIAFAQLDLVPESTVGPGIDQRFGDVGAAAVDVVLGQLHRNERGVPSVPRNLLVPGRLVAPVAG
jgi:LacI family transcriptional regulator